MRNVMIAMVLAACGSPAPVAPSQPAKVVPPRTCATKYTAETSTPAPPEAASAGAAIVAARGPLDAFVAPGAPVIAAALELHVTLRAAIDAIPTGCTPAWFAEQRLDIQPAMTDTPPERAKAIDAGIAELGAATQIVGACGGCPAIALALASTSPPRVSAWSALDR